jgi:hypothetical protein
LQVALARRHAAHVADDWLDDDGGDAVAVLFKHGGQRRLVVEGRGDGVARYFGGDAGAVGQSERRHAGARLDEEAVAVAVVTALELDDLAAARDAAREAERGHRRLGPAVDHPHHLDRWHGVNNLLGHLDFQTRRRAVTRPAPQGLAQGLDDLLVRVP